MKHVLLIIFLFVFCLVLTQGSRMVAATYWNCGLVLLFSLSMTIIATLFLGLFFEAGASCGVAILCGMIGYFAYEEGMEEIGG